MVMTTVATVPQRTHQPDESAIQRFERALNDYGRMRQRVEGQVPAFEVTADPRTTQAAVAARAAAIRAARADARPGDIFGDGPDVAFGGLIVKALAGCGFRVADLFEDRDDEGEMPAGTPKPEVNEVYPSVWGRAMWPTVLNALPVLPAFLQYRLAGRDLVLLDADANLVVDVLTNALPAS